MIAREQRFTAPGTWTWPGVNKTVEVIVVGGGGGGAADQTPALVGPSIIGVGGGGGGVKRAVVPVSAPVPVTVGAGGAAASPGTGNNAAIGGTSSFGPLGPGPIPLIPASTIAAGGGGGGGGANPNRNAPPIGGGGGGGIIYTGPVTQGFFVSTGGLGRGGIRESGGSMRSVSGLSSSANVPGLYGLAGGGATGYFSGSDGAASGYQNTSYPDSPAKANMGGGGYGSAAGGSGVVIVRWFE